MCQQRTAFHCTMTISRIASGGAARNASSRRSSRMSAMASIRFCRHSSMVCPCPFAPGTSGQVAMYQSPSCSINAVNSLCIDCLHCTTNLHQGHKKCRRIVELPALLPENDAPADDGVNYICLLNVVSRDVKDVLRKHGDVGEPARCERAFVA